MNNIWILLGALSCALSVMIGAFGAHALKDILANEYSRNIYDKANFYHFIHSLALIVNGILTKLFTELNFSLSGYLFLIGIILFSFSLYTLAIYTEIKILGAITPIGAILYFIGSLTLLYFMYKYAV